MSILIEQINAIKRAHAFLDELRFGNKRLKRSEMLSRISRIMRHFPLDVELDVWHQWLVTRKGHE